MGDLGAVSTHSLGRQGARTEPPLPPPKPPPRTGRAIRHLGAGKVSDTLARFLKPPKRLLNLAEPASCSYTFEGIEVVREAWVTFGPSQCNLWARAEPCPKPPPLARLLKISSPVPSVYPRVH